MKKQSKPKKRTRAKFFYAVGRRKVANARVRLYPRQKGEMLVNDKPVEEYFPGEIAKSIYMAPLETCNAVGKYLITVRITGSGKNGQLQALVHGLARVLEKQDKEKNRIPLKKRGFLSRDPRAKERRKPGTGGKARRKKQSPRR